ncbi:MAG: hypothetical protein JO131_02410, partial [Gammaproteobacteria bacterium]|nr:hypothetical protein [Gammaproteobacteria bacterium]
EVEGSEVERRNEGRSDVEEGSEVERRNERRRIEGKSDVEDGSEVEARRNIHPGVINLSMPKYYGSHAVTELT